MAKENKLQYIGPDYKNHIVIGTSHYAPKGWRDAAIKKMIKKDPRLERYFAKVEEGSTD